MRVEGITFEKNTPSVQREFLAAQESRCNFPPFCNGSDRGLTIRN